MEITRPPDGYRCDGHEPLLREVLQARGDYRVATERMDGLENKIDAVDRKVDLLDKKISSGFITVNDSIRELTLARNSDVRALTARVDNIDRTQQAGIGGAKLLQWAIPILVSLVGIAAGIIIAIAG